MDSINLGIIITSITGGALLGIKNTKSEINKLKDSVLSTQEKINAMNEVASNSFKKSGLSAFRAFSAVALLAKPAIEFESAMADVKKVVDFDTPQQFKQMQNDILGLTRTLPLAGEELAQIAASGGQLGVAREDIKSFTTTIAKMATAFDMSASESGDAMAKLANVYKIPIANISELGDVINHLSNSSPAKANDIVNTLGRIGGVAKQFGLTANQASSLASAFIALGKTPETAGTAINSMMTTLATADKAPAKVQKALGALGLSAEHLKANIAKDGEGAIMDLLKRINLLPKDTQTGILVDIFGRQFADDIAVLAGGVDTYQKSIDLLNAKNTDGKFEYLGSMEKEFNARAGTTENNLQLLKNSITEINVVLGETFLPVINDLITSIKPAIYSVTEFAKAHPDLIATTLKLTGVLVGLKIGYWGILGLVFKVGVFVKKFTPSLASLARISLHLGKIALPVIATGLKFIGRALFMNPIGLAITAIAGSALLIYKYWAPLKNFFGNLFSGIKNIFSSAFTTFKGIGSFLIEGLVGGIFEKITAVKDSIVSVASSISDWFKSALGIHSPSRVFAGFGQNITEGLSIGINGGESSPKQSIKKLASDLSNTNFDSLNAKGNFANNGGANQQNITINFNPTINANNGNTNDIKQALNMSLIEFERLFNRMMQNRTREAF